MGILQTLWDDLLGGGYTVLMDGFSKIPYCSTEGRALMSMDVTSYRSGTSSRSIAERLRDHDPSSKSCPLPPETNPYRNMSYVDTYIKIFYFPLNVSTCLLWDFGISQVLWPNLSLTLLTFLFDLQDALEWIKANYQQYHQHHVISLVINDRDAKRLMAQISKCYGGVAHAETIRI